jgi:hypothetical protein
MIEAAKNKIIDKAPSTKMVVYIGHQEEKYTPSRGGGNFVLPRGKAVSLPAGLADDLIKNNPESYKEA